MKTVSLLLFLFILAYSNSVTNDYPVSQSLVIDDYEVNKNTEETAVSKELDSSENQKQNIIKSARLIFESAVLTETHKDTFHLANIFNGAVQNDKSSKNYNRLYANMVIRTPNQSFEPPIDGMSQEVSYYDQNEINRGDVSEEFIDLEANLKAKHELEKRYIELLKQAKNMKEMLNIERELSKIREEIKAKQGRLKFHQNLFSLRLLPYSFIC